MEIFFLLTALEAGGGILRGSGSGSVVPGPPPAPLLKVGSAGIPQLS